MDYRTEDITATATSDYQHLEGSLPFFPGETSKTIEIRIFEDTLEEHFGEKFQLVLTPSADSSLSPLRATATLTDSNPTISLLAIDSGFQMLGPANSLLTYAISSAGDVDQDGYGDFLISAPGASNSQGKIYLVAGAQGIEVLNQGLNVDQLNASQGLCITGVANATAQTGYTLSNWGDYYAISAPNLSYDASGSSSIYVFSRNTLNQYFKTHTTVGITSLDNSPLTGSSENAFGKNLLLADLNKDSIPELIVGSPLSNQVLIYTLSGNQKTLRATLSLPGTQSLGSALQVLDLNGDGYLDIAMGASTANPINDSAGNLAGYGGAIYVLKGTSSLPENLLLSTSTSSVNWVFNGASNLTGNGEEVTSNPSSGEMSEDQQTSTPFYDRVGNALAVLDLNHDGHQDLAIGAPNAAVGSGYTATANLGKVYVLYGNQNPSLSQLNQIVAGVGVTFQGVLASGQAGWEVANGNDVNQDGIEDLLIGAPFAYGNAGSAYIAFGSTNAYKTSSTIQLDPNIPNSRVFQYQGVANPLGGDSLFNQGSVGQSLGGVGDINGDYNQSTGGDDIVIGAPSVMSQKFACKGVGACPGSNLQSQSS